MTYVFKKVSPSGLSVFLMLMGLALPAHAQDTTQDAPSKTEAPADAKPDAPKPTGFWERDTLTGDWGGTRTDLEDAGIKFSGNEISDGLMNFSGGLKTGATYQGQTELDLALDLDKLLGWTGASVKISGVTVHGRSLSTNRTGALLTSSSIDSDRGSRLVDLYLDQSFSDFAAVRIGQGGADEEFMISKVATPFVNAAFGYPGLPSIDQPSGGPAMPLDTPMVRLKLTPTEQWTVLIAAFNGDPTGAGFAADPSPADPSGTAFRFSDGVLGFLEAQYAVNQEDDAPGLPASYKLGVWVHSGRFIDQDSRTQRRDLNGDFSVYGIVDQMLWRRPDTKDEGVSVFAEAMGAPDDRNLVDLTLDAGVAYKGPFEGRGDDIAGLAVSYSKISDAAQEFDRQLAVTTPGRPIRDYEIDVEATYQYNLTPWWQLQPTLQYIAHPGGNVPISDRLPTDVTKDAVVAGLRTTITF